MTKYAGISGRESASPHIKTYTRVNGQGELAWALMTSANVSKAAWGELQKSGKQFQIRHYEIGVAFLPSDYGWRAMWPLVEGAGGGEVTETSMTVPLPCRVPGVGYGVGDEPWVWDRPQENLDVFGQTWQGHGFHGGN